MVLATIGGPRFTAAAETSGEPAASAPPTAYFVVVASTTLAYPPHGGPVARTQPGLSPPVGFDWFLKETVGIELDLGPTLVHGRHATFSLTPSAVEELAGTADEHPAQADALQQLIGFFRVDAAPAVMSPQWTPAAGVRGGPSTRLLSEHRVAAGS